MSLNKLAIDIIKSNYIKDCIEKESYEFGYDEQLAIILNSDEELSKKVDILKMYVNNKEVIDELGKSYIDDIKEIIEEMNEVIEYVNGKIDCVILTYKTDTDLICARRLSKLLDKVMIEDCIEVDLYNIDEAEQIGYVIVNNNKEAISYCLTSGLDSDLYNKFVNIPNDLHIGDVVSTVGSDNKYIIVSNPILPNKFKNGLTYKDTSVVVIPIELLDPNSDYKKQIEEIYTDRINNIENPYAKPDIIMEYYTTVNILNIQK